MPEEKIPVTIVGRHPHKGTKGYLLSVDGVIETVMEGKMKKVYFDKPSYGVEACFADDRDISKKGAPPAKNRAPALRGQVIYPRRSPTASQKDPD